MRGRLQASVVFPVIAFTAIGITGARQLEAAALYSNLGPGDSFSLVDSWPVTGPVTSNDFSAIGVQFVPTSSGKVASIDVAFFQDEASSASDIVFQLWADNGSNFPDFGSGPLDELTLSGTGIPEIPALYNVPSTLSPVLSIGTPYWLIASSGGRGFFGWNQTDPALSGNLFADTTDPADGDGTFSPQVLATLRVNAVPEPSTLGLAAMGLGLLAFFWKRRGG